MTKHTHTMILGKNQTGSKKGGGKEEKEKRKYDII